MAELKGLARQKFLDLFLSAYNRIHHTAFAGQPIEAPHTDWDYRWPSSARGAPPLLVQHTCAASNEKEERAKRAIAGQWAYAEIQEPLMSGALKGFKLTIWVHRLPDSRRDRKAMGAVLRETILRSVVSPLSPGEKRILAPHADDMGIAEMELEGIDADRSNISIQGPPFHFDHDVVAARGLEALRKKQLHLGPVPSEVVLAIFFDLTPYGDTELGEMRAALRRETVHFREVWAVNPWQPGARADRLWPV
ncbi:MAG: hypothetical protein V1907_01275 [Candidatus Kerfeldbacteria bacterium]